MISTSAAASMEPVPKHDQRDADVLVARHERDADRRTDGEEQVVEALVVGERLRDRGGLLRRAEDAARRRVGPAQRLQHEDVDVHEGGEPGEHTGGEQHGLRRLSEFARLDRMSQQQNFRIPTSALTLEYPLSLGVYESTSRRSRPSTSSPTTSSRCRTA